MKTWMGAGFGALALLATSASADVFDNLMNDVQASKLPMNAIQSGRQSLAGVEFRSDDEMGAATALFTMGTDEISLNQNTLDPATGILKHLAEIGVVDASVVIHELWHSYYWNTFQHTPSAALTLYVQEYQTRYNDYSSDVHEEIQEEGYALFIQEIARDYLQTYLILSRATPAQRKTLKANPKFLQLYAQSFTQSTCGYYRGDDGAPIFVQTPITAADRTSILSFFFQNKLTGDLIKDFPQF